MSKKFVGTKETEDFYQYKVEEGDNIIADIKKMR